MADWLGELHALLGVSETRVVGHSMGALVAYALCSRQPELCRHLVLLGISHPMPVAAAMLAAAQDDHPAAFEMANTWRNTTLGSVLSNVGLPVSVKG